MRALLLLPLAALASATVHEPDTSCAAYTQALELMHGLERTERGAAGNIASGKGNRVKKGDVWAMVWRGQGESQTVSCAEPSSGGWAARIKPCKASMSSEESQNISVLQRGLPDTQSTAPRTVQAERDRVLLRPAGMTSTNGGIASSSTVSFDTS